jgi:hypothetical protein
MLAAACWCCTPQLEQQCGVKQLPAQLLESVVKHQVDGQRRLAQDQHCSQQL